MLDVSDFEAAPSCDVATAAKSTKHLFIILANVEGPTRQELKIGFFPKKSYSSGYVCVKILPVLAATHFN